MGPRTVAVRERSLRSYAYLAVAKYVLFTHSCLIHRFAPRVASVYVGHGMPVKRIGWMNNEGSLVAVTRHAVATSPLWAGIVQESIRPLAGTLVTGIPRNDRLLRGKKGSRARLGGPPEGGRLIVWLPTFRGQWEDATHTLGVGADSLRQINDVLEHEGAFAVVKPHPMAAHDGLPELSRFRMITDAWLEEQGFGLYELLGEADALVTDVSSVYVDYLILDRPVVHHFPDILEYERSRGFSVSPIADYLAGPLTTDPGGLLAAMSDVARGNDTHALQRARVRGLFHTHTDALATARLLHAVGLRPEFEPPATSSGSSSSSPG